MEDSDAFDVVESYYLFNSLAVRIQYNQREYSKHAPEEGLKKGTLMKKVSRKTPRKRTL